MNKGKVYLIGAGPGDPGLLTCRAKQLLSDCDVVCYDKLVAPAILAMIPSHVELHQVGYRGYQGGHITYDMHPDVMEFALAGKTIARLKSGDPCIFGRTTEECRDLKQHGIAYEIVPGITAALGAASYSGFPLTSGGIASSVTFVSGHEHSKTIASWGELGRAGGTLVLYMGAKKLAQHAVNLMNNGRDPNTPIALISSATRADHTCVIATLATIAEKIENNELTGPALTIIGDVVSQSSELDWRSLLPFTGTSFLVCGQYSDAKSLKEQGGEVIEIAQLPTESLLDEKDLHFLASQRELSFSDFTSFTHWLQAIEKYRFDIRQFAMPMGSQSSAVRSALRKIGINYATVSDKSIKLTMDEVKSLAIIEHTYLVGRYKKQPLAYTLPNIDWLLVDDVLIAQSLIQQNPDLVQKTKIVPLNDQARIWALKNNYILSENDIPDFIDDSELSQPYECSYVA
ncbi:uroporphyrinogen-III C-methyltransferase [Vibrio sp. DW001]|uniref:uroporphyrinogen-III C-methyltransferase n=1 Tax=Vibrio sp. DW001 TaxID=2912315 RepID=UPI0023B172E5|nr:uroporphyrinogen-III C-methyltransferase [Vibrio sp. DW001]WED28720.1 uroporphyrinogen-III C-methyltransferase [Vibrio sp. DW001]